MKGIYSILDWDRFITESHPLLKKYFKAEEIWVESLNNLSVLEIGCGSGRIIDHIKKHAKFVAGIDKEIGMITKAINKIGSSNNNVELSVQEAKKLTYENNKFDRVICMGNTFGNFGVEKTAILREMQRVCRKEGEIVLSVYNEQALVPRLASYAKDNLKIAKIEDDGTITMKEGIITEQFSSDKLEEILKNAKMPHYSITKLTSIGYLVRINKI